MTVQIFLMLLMVFSVATSLITQVLKKFLDEINIKYASNIIVLVVAVVVGICGMVSYYILNGIEFSAANVIYVLLITVANWLSAMVGYDKVVQAINQMKSK